MEGARTVELAMNRPSYWLMNWKLLLAIAAVLALLNIATGQKPPFLEQQPSQQSK